MRLGLAVDTDVAPQQPPEAGLDDAPTWRHWPDEPWVLFVVLGAALIILTGTIQLTQPLDRDEGAFLVMAQSLLHGHVPYRDLFDHKSPGIYLVYAAVLAFTSHLSFMQQVVTLHLLVALTNLVSAAGLFLLGRRWKSLEVGALAAALWLIALPLYGGVSAFTEPFATAATIWAFVVASRQPSPRSVFGVGILLALASLFKQTGVLAIPGVALLLYCNLLPERHWWPGLRPLLANSGLLLAGLIAPWLLVLAAFAAAGAGQPFILDVLIANLHYPPDPAIATISAIVSAVKQFPFLWFTPILLGCLGGWTWLRHWHVARARLNHGLAAAGITGLLNMVPFASHAYPHYWIQVLPWAALFCSVAIMNVVTRWLPPRMKWATDSTLTAADHALRRLTLPVLFGVLIATSSSNSLFVTAHLDVNSAGLQQQIAAGAWIRQHVAPSARLLVAPAEPELYYLSGHAPATHFAYLLPVDDTPAVMDNLIGQIQRGQFDAVIWQEESTDANPKSVDDALFAALTARYHVVSSDNALHLLLFEPTATGG